MTTVYSMTGYASTQWPAVPESALAGTAQAASEGGLALEMRSVNGRFLDVVLRLPDEWRAAEPALRELVAATLRRGKVEVRVSVRGHDTEALAEPTVAQLDRLDAVQRQVLERMPQARPLSVHEALQWCRQVAPAPAAGEQALLDAARACLHALKEAREREGARLARMLMERVQRLRELAMDAAPRVPAAVQRLQERFLERWHDALTMARASAPPEEPAAGGGVDGQVPPRPGAAAPAGGDAASAQDRALQEAAAYALRIDIAEELSRLGSHLDEVERLLRQGGELGKRLDFLVQELHREANTLGSKAATRELGAISMEMRVLIEQMREQVQNIE